MKYNGGLWACSYGLFTIAYYKDDEVYKAFNTQSGDQYAGDFESLDKVLNTLKALRMKQDYMTAKGTACPYCKSGSINGGFIEIEGDHAFQKITCIDCSGVWEDAYKLVDVTLKDGGK